jgi:hypothetical protein
MLKLAAMDLTEKRPPVEAEPRGLPPVGGSERPAQEPVARRRLSDVVEAVADRAVATANRWGLAGGALGAAVGILLALVTAVLRGRIAADVGTTAAVAVMGVFEHGLGTGFLLGIVGYFLGLIVGAVRGLVGDRIGSEVRPHGYGGRIVRALVWALGEPEGARDQPVRPAEPAAVEPQRDHRPAFGPNGENHKR